jgi:hypothetical protein
MATVSAPAPRASAASPPVRHGICRLTLTIGGTDYRLRPHPTPPPGFKIWTLRKLDPHGPSAAYAIAVHDHEVGCTCPDHEINGASCKHIMALRALKLVARNIKVRAARPVAAPAKARRLHADNARAAIDDAAREFAAGMPAAVADHLARMRKGGDR